MISRLLIFFFLVSHYIPQQPEIILMPFTLDFSHCYLILNGYFPLFLHLVMSVRFSALLGAALLLFKSFCPFFLLNILVKGNTCLVFLLSPPPPLPNPSLLPNSCSCQNYSTFLLSCTAIIVSVVTNLCFISQ